MDCVLLWVGNRQVWRKPLACLVSRLLHDGNTAERYCNNAYCIGLTVAELPVRVTTHADLQLYLEKLESLTNRLRIMIQPISDFTHTLVHPSYSSSILQRQLLIWPFWLMFTMSNSLKINFVVAASGTLVVLWNAPFMQATRTVLWRSKMVRMTAELVTGLSFRDAERIDSVAKPLNASKKSEGGEMRFAFTLYENQRRWLGIGWTSNLFPTERSPWTDEIGNAVAPAGEFKLPDDQVSFYGDADDEPMKNKRITRWRWCEPQWANGESDTSDGWKYFDNRWAHESEKEEFGKYTRRRKWRRTAELEEINELAVADNEKQKEQITSDMLAEAVAV